MVISPENWSICIDTYGKVLDDHSAALDEEALERLVASLYKKTRKRRRKEAARHVDDTTSARRKQQSQRDRKRHREADQKVINTTQITATHLQKEQPERSSKDAESALVQGRLRTCYACGTRHNRIHHYYAMLCISCAEEHLAHREARIDLSGRRALAV